jgi:thymidylate synthase ThyX
VTQQLATVETFTDEEREALRPYFTNLDRPIFALINLPEVVKGALFARYSRSAKSLRRLFLDEFLDQVCTGTMQQAVGVERAEKLYERVFLEYGDDSVAQLGGVHLACEGVSNVLTKILEWGRLMAYLEQSTRYVPYTDRPGGRWKYHVPAELEDPGLRGEFVGSLDLAFETYARWLEPMQEYFSDRYPRDEGVSKAVYRRTIQAKALDSLRGLLPAATLANVGIFGTGQAYEALLLRMRANPLLEARECAERMLEELRKVIPAFLRRVDLADRGVVWSCYLRETRESTARLAGELLAQTRPQPRPDVTLSDFDPEGEVKVVAAALYPVSSLPDDQLLAQARLMTTEQRIGVLRAYVGDRSNRRHKPGRAFERATYRFDILSDYGAFRDLQRHRMLTLEWQPLSTDHGWVAGDAIEAAGASAEWSRVMERSAHAYEALREAGLDEVAPYAVSRTTPQGHPSYRRVCQTMHRLIAEEAGHRAIAESMRFADHSEVELERLEAERSAERRKNNGLR